MEIGRTENANAKNAKKKCSVSNNQRSQVPLPSTTSFQRSLPMGLGHNARKSRKSR